MLSSGYYSSQYSFSKCVTTCTVYFCVYVHKMTLWTMKGILEHIVHLSYIDIIQITHIHMYTCICMYVYVFVYDAVCLRFGRWKWSSDHFAFNSWKVRTEVGIVSWLGYVSYFLSWWSAWDWPPACSTWPLGCFTPHWWAPPLSTLQAWRRGETIWGSRLPALPVHVHLLFLGMWPGEFQLMHQTQKQQSHIDCMSCSPNCMLGCGIGSNPYYPLCTFPFET